MDFYTIYKTHKLIGGTDILLRSCYTNKKVPCEENGIQLNWISTSESDSVYLQLTCSRCLRRLSRICRRRRSGCWSREPSGRSSVCVWPEDERQKRFNDGESVMSHAALTGLRSESGLRSSSKWKIYFFYIV